MLAHIWCTFGLLVMGVMHDLSYSMSVASNKDHRSVTHEIFKQFDNAVVKGIVGNGQVKIVFTCQRQLTDGESHDAHLDRNMKPSDCISPASQ